MSCSISITGRVMSNGCSEDHIFKPDPIFNDGYCHCGRSKVDAHHVSSVIKIVEPTLLSINRIIKIVWPRGNMGTHILLSSDSLEQMVIGFNETTKVLDRLGVLVNDLANIIFDNHDILDKDSVARAREILEELNSL